MTPAVRETHHPITQSPVIHHPSPALSIVGIVRTVVVAIRYTVAVAVPCPTARGAVVGVGNAVVVPIPARAAAVGRAILGIGNAVAVPVPARGLMMPAS